MAPELPLAVFPEPLEPILDVREIQGNIFPGFNKSQQRLIGLRVTDSAAARRWIGTMADRVATVDEVYRFNQLRRSMLARRGRESAGLAATWINIAFSAEGL